VGDGCGALRTRESAVSAAFRRVLVVDLLGGLGDLMMALPAVHALARRHAPLRVLTHPPGDALLRHDPAVAAVAVAPRGRERAAVGAALDRWVPDLVVSTTRYDGIADEIESRSVRCVTNLWRRPPPDVPVGRRYLEILAAEGLVGLDDVRAWASARLALTAAERATGTAVLDAHLPLGPSPAPGSSPRVHPYATDATHPPVVLLPGAGMAVKVWPHWSTLAAALADRGRAPLVAGEQVVLDAWHGPGRPLPATDLRGLAAVFAAVGRRGGVVVGPDTGPLRVAAATGARTVGIFGPTLADRYGLGAGSRDLQGLPACPHRRPTAITEQVCWWDAQCPLAAAPACLADVGVDAVLAAVVR